MSYGAHELAEVFFWYFAIDFLIFFLIFSSGELVNQILKLF
jgi:hypothetical protein